jgi:CxxC motif-containing protein (DUF1111 family)
MHDGASATRDEAILRHKGEAAAIKNKFAALNAQQKAQLVTFLNVL